MTDAASSPEPESSSESDDTHEADDARESDQPEGKSPLEWTVTGIGVLVVLFVVGFFVYEWVSREDAPADLVVSLGSPAAKGASVEVPVEVENVGRTVAQVAVVEVCAGEASCAQITFDYVPYGSRVAGVIGLAAPLGGPLTSRVVSFVEP